MAHPEQPEEFVLVNASRAAVRNLIHAAVKSGALRRSNEGEPFTLLVDNKTATALRHHGVLLKPTNPYLVSGQEPTVLAYTLEWDDDPTLEGSHNVLRYYDNNMDTLMQDLNGIRVVNTQPPQPRVELLATYAGRVAANEKMKTR